MSRHVATLTLGWPFLERLLRLPPDTHILGAESRDYGHHLSVLVEGAALPETPDEATPPTGVLVYEKDHRHARIVLSPRKAGG